MSSLIKVNACVYSRIGYGRSNNTSSFYMNGKFTSENHIENVQASMENRGSEYLFAVSDNMICENPDDDTNISILKELGKFHEKITVNGGDVDLKAQELESRVNDSERLLTSILEINRVHQDDSRWDIGFSGLLLSEGQFVALSQGCGHVYMLRDGMFKPLASETTKAKRAIDAKVHDCDGDLDNIELPGREKQGSVIVSDVYDLKEGDSFILLSNGLLEALGEDKVEDFLALRSDSSYIAYRLVDEAMKRKSSGDLTALVVQIEKVVEGQAPSRRAAQRNQTPQQVMKSKVDKFNKAPAIAYKYNKRSSSKYQSIVFMTLIVLTVAVLFGLLVLIISSLMNTGKNSIIPPKPTVTATAAPTPTPTEVTPDPPEETATSEPTPPPDTGEIKEHKVKAGESINSIARTYYGDVSLVSKLCKYNDISDPNKIQIGKVIKIPPKEVLAGQ